MLRERGLGVRRPDKTVATVDHSLPTHDRSLPIADELAARQIRQLEDNCREFGITLHGSSSPRQVCRTQMWVSIPQSTTVLRPAAARSRPSPRSVSQTDHTSFENAGLPGFQFIQERLEYNSRTHHSNMDTFDHVQPDDLKQQGAVAAVFAWYAANWPEKLPRK